MRRWIAAATAVPALAGCGSGQEAPLVLDCAAITADLEARQTGMTSTATGLLYEQVREGEGPPAEVGQQVQTHYTLCSTDGRQIDSSRERGEALGFALGQGEMIAGYDEGVQGMKAGGRRILVLPPEIAYGSRSLPGLPPNSTLVFEVELVAIE